jgi:hypothetical protein
MLELAMLPTADAAAAPTATHVNHPPSQYAKNILI